MKSKHVFNQLNHKGFEEAARDFPVLLSLSKDARRWAGAWRLVPKTIRQELGKTLRDKKFNHLQS